MISTLLAMLFDMGRVISPFKRDGAMIFIFVISGTKIRKNCVF